jgi:hypothetical protein
LPQHFFLDEGQQFGFLFEEGIDSFVVGQGLIEQRLDDLQAGMLGGFLMRVGIKIDDMFFVFTEKASIVTR